MITEAKKRTTDNGQRTTSYAKIAIDVPLRTTFTYRIPTHLRESIARGKRVLVSFGRKKMVGICLGLDETFVSFQANGKKIEDKNLKDIEEIIDEYVFLDNDYLQWLEFASAYYMAPIGQVLSQALPSFYFDIKKIGKEKKIKFKEISFASDFTTNSITLTQEQQQVYQAILKHLNSYYPALIHGITGSGKTEVYIQLIHEVLRQRKSALLLVPEIGLTPQMMTRLNHHFKGSLLVYHSGLSINQRVNQWQHCLAQEPKVMVGTRSALFAPFKNLGLIIVDEEQDSSYKQDDRFRYHARNMALSRGKQLNIPVILGTATPSLETYYQTQENKYAYYELKERIGLAKLPDIRVIDFGKEREQTGNALMVSQNIHDAIEHFHKQGRQMMIFVGQRGFAQNAFCTACHQIQVCPNCSVGLKFHKPLYNLKCHYCDYAISFDGACGQCQEKSLTLLGFGTQSIEEELRIMHPRVRMARLDSDHVTKVSDLHQTLADFYTKKIDLLVGTQMITKGHDFDDVGFVGVLGIDAHLGLPDFRASERSFQTIVQVAGRAGRSQKKGHVIIQSLMPNHKSITFGVKQDYACFANDELEFREALQYPPYSRLIQFRFISHQEARLKDFMGTWAVFLNQVRQKTNSDEFKILGPAEMPVYKVRGKYRYHVLLKIKRGLKIADIMNYLITDLDERKLKGINYQIDVDAEGLV
ncbi:primosomal protein N' [bacterium]|nr:primosomal protein N' [bacterium]